MNIQLFTITELHNHLITQPAGPAAAAATLDAPAAVLLGTLEDLYALANAKGKTLWIPLRDLLDLEIGHPPRHEPIRPAELERRQWRTRQVLRQAIENKQFATVATLLLTLAAAAMGYAWLPLPTMP